MCFVPLEIIPTCTGNTQSGRLTSKFKWDHPRTCGEHSTVTISPLLSVGSSPHVRGALSQLQCPCRWLGIIPACAGSTRTLRGFRTGRWDHPRMCGEHYVHRPQLDWDVGSSPHVRGAPVVHGLLDGLGGIIPACAGSTTPPAQDRHATRDHPRMCGEHIQRVLRRIAEQGSSPHVRGARSRSVGG